MVKCNVCFTIERRDKLLVPKLDSLVKHFGLKKCIIAKPNIIVG